MEQEPLSRRFNHSVWFRLLLTPFLILRYKWRLWSGSQKVVTERLLNPRKVIVSICGHCSELLPKSDYLAFQTWGNAKYLPVPLPMKIADSDKDETVMTFHASHHHHFPSGCRSCGTLHYNIYAIKILKIMVLIYY